ncbi:aldo/keto reductase [Maribacter sp. 2307ULW6-5]|uniref:aldo/keto reductase n=1 Tax=Maribacter sp. 2307ULW6-5 TaxID=3386275 RepID=UPI0039BCF973
MKNGKPYSRIIAGTMTWGRWGQRWKTPQMSAYMEYALELGIRTFDHADIYGDYTTEEEFGRALADTKIAREDIQLISKCGIQLKGTDRQNPLKHYDHGEDYIAASVERSLNKLQTSYLDLLLLHRPSPLMRPEAVASAVVKLMAQGKVRAFGVSNFTPSQIALLETQLSVGAHQLQYALTHTEAMYNGVLDDGMMHQRTTMAWGPLGHYFRDGEQEKGPLKSVMAQLATKYGATEDQLLLAWVMHHPAHLHPVVGTTNRERLKRAQGAVELELQPVDWFLMLQAATGKEVP